MNIRSMKGGAGLEKIRLLLLDVDGVLTDGTLIYHDDGSEAKHFHSGDGMGIRLLLEAGVAVGIVTGRTSGALKHRCANLGIDLIFDGVKEKAQVLETILEKTGLRAEEIAYVGDDLPDIPLMRRVGVGIAVGSAHDAVVNAADVTTLKGGGRGAVREVCDGILKFQGRWEQSVERFLEG